MAETHNKTTTPLSPESSTNNTIRTASANASTHPLQSTTNTPDTQNQQAQSQPTQTPQEPVKVDELQLTVIEGTQIARGVARIDPTDISRMGCQPGDVVMVTGGRTTAAEQRIWSGRARHSS